MSITTWTRLEPDIQTAQPELDLNDGVSGRVADPLWLLGRQWQLGELSGADAASPVTVDIAASSFPIDHLQTGTASIAYTPTSVPLEAIIEHDGRPADLRTRASGGAVFLDLLGESKLTAYQEKAADSYPLDGTAPDGDSLLHDLDSNTLASKLQVVQADSQAFASVCKTWAVWYRPRSNPRPNPAWIANRLEYQFSLQATVREGRLTIDAPEHLGGRIDWDAFTAQPPRPGATATPKAITARVAPTLLQIPGMPALAFWEMEDPGFDAGNIEAAPSDPARLLLVETALAYASDWFLVPLTLPAATLSSIDKLADTDTFGVTTLIRPADQVRPFAGWRMWSVSGLPYLLLPPPEIESLVADPLDQVVFMRDEAANLGWALSIIPRVIPASTPLPGPQPGADYLYIPMTSPPDGRTPLVLRETSGGRMLLQGILKGAPAPDPASLLGNKFQLHDEDLPDEGLRLDRRFELGRTPDGALHLWVSRVKRPGAKLPASGLDFDQLVAEG
jgi:hypothetical protein